jgi:xanthine dehydrogenase YagR molybdenum-binding subunit
MTATAQPATGLRQPAVGAAMSRLDGPAKVTGAARYAFEHDVGPRAYLYPVSATIVRGRIRGIDTAAAEAEPGVLAVLTHRNAPRLASADDAELAVCQDEEVRFRGQFIGAVVAETSEAARHAAGLVRADYEQSPYDVDFSADRDDLYRPDVVNGGYPPDTGTGDPDAALRDAAVTIEHDYVTPTEHNNPMEPHTTIARWDGDALTLWDSTQGVHSVRATLAPVFGLGDGQLRVISPYVGGGFGSKGVPHANLVLAALAARLVPGRAVTFPLTRQQMFFVAGYRCPTINRVRLGADADGRLRAITADVVAQTSRCKEFAEQAAVPARTMYAAPHRRSTHRLAPLDVPVPSWMRAPGECPGTFGPEVAMDELAYACGVDPIELRVRNEPDSDPESGKAYSSRNVLACLREGAARFGWNERDPRPRSRAEGGWLVGTGVASSAYPVLQLPGSQARIRAHPGGMYDVTIGAADIGTGTWTALTQIAADALGADVDHVELSIGDSALPPASVEGGSSGITCWGSAIVHAAQKLRERLDGEYGGAVPDGGVEATGQTERNPQAERFAMHAFGAQFAEVRVHELTGDVRVARLLGVFAAGRIVNPTTARSQFIGGMTMGLSMALHEQSFFDRSLGQVANHDFAEYHIATNADAPSVEATWVDEDDPHVNPMGTKGIGEIGIVGTAAAIANAAFHATGVRVRELPITCEHFFS